MSVVTNLETVISKLQDAISENKITKSAERNIRKWLTEDRYSDYAAEVAAHIEDEKWSELDDAFWTVIPFGTGGRRGKMYPIGSNAINDRTIGESAQGLADYVKENREGNGPLSCAIAYDTRHKSPEFARLCAEIMVGNGFQVCFFDEHRSTPELSFMVRYKNCSCGIMVTASHNPPSDNAVKVYWSTGGQILPPHDKGVIDRVMSTEQILRADFEKAVAEGKVEFCNEEVDAAFIAVVKQQAFPGARDLKVIYSPLHGVGATAAVPALQADGFKDVEVFADHAEPSGDFPNVPDHVANPENVAVFDAIITRAKSVKADLILASDPDCDRLGCAAPLTLDAAGEWKTFNGNQIGALLADFVLQQRQKKAGSLTGDHYVVKTLVTTEMIRRIADSYGVKTFGDLLVGFKWIGGVIDEQGPDRFVFGTEESHGYLVGQYARDKDGAVASMLMAELAVDAKANGQSLHERLDSLFKTHGYHAEHLMTQHMPGSEGMGRMQALMKKFRSEPPTTLAGIPVARVRDYEHNTVHAKGSTQPLAGPTGDLVIFDLMQEGNYVAARPSGTEPKVKFYIFTYVAPERIADDLEKTKQDMARRIGHIESDIRAFADTV